MAEVDEAMKWAREQAASDWELLGCPSWAQLTREGQADDQDVLEAAEAHRAGQASRDAEVAALRAALGQMIYETTHLSPMEADGSHWCRISATALADARAALEGDRP